MKRKIKLRIAIGLVQQIILLLGIQGGALAKYTTDIRLQQNLTVRIETDTSMAPQNTWYKGQIPVANITGIKFVTDIPQDIQVTETWDAQAEQNQGITCALSDQVVYLSQNGKDTIVANADCQMMFYGFSSLTSIENLSMLDTRNATTMSGMFQGCTSLTNLVLQGFDTSKVTNMAYMFFECSNLISLDLSRFNTSSVTDMQAMFYGCSNLISLDLQSFNTSSVTNMEYMFNKCKQLTELDIQNFDTSEVTRMTGMFQGCTSITSLDLQSFNTALVTDMTFMFSGCSNLTELNIQSFDTSKVNNMYCMFSDCRSIISIDL